MGSTTSKGKKYQDTSKYGDIYVQTDQKTYQSGDTVTGTIYINLISDYPGNQLFLKFKGIEAVYFVEWRKKGDLYMNEFHSTGHCMLKKSIPIYSYNNSSAGQFTIPFSFMVPHGLPASFYQHGHRYLGKIEYKLEAYIQPTDPSVPKLKYKQPLILREIVKPQIGDLLTDVKRELTSCCNPKGFTSIKVNFEKNFYCPGETARVIIEVDNSEAKLKNLKVVFALKQRLVLFAGGRTFSKDLAKVEQELPAVKKGTKTDFGSVSIVLPRFPNENDYKRDFDESNITQNLLLGFKETNDVITSTVHGKKLFSEFILEVSCPTSGCWATVPTAECKIGIVAPEFELPLVTAPPNWNPSSLQAVKVVFPYADPDAQKDSMPSNTTGNNMVQPLQENAQITGSNFAQGQKMDMDSMRQLAAELALKKAAKEEKPIEANI